MGSRRRLVVVAACLAVGFFISCQAFSFYPPKPYRFGIHVATTLPVSPWRYSKLAMASDDNGNNVEILVNDEESGDDEEVEPGKMRVSEIKAELDLRGISYKDCFDKESLEQRLREARATGKADPSILDKFNRQKLEDTLQQQKVEIRDEDLEKVVANDGTLPGGLNPEMFKKLTSNPELMTLLQSVKMQEAMKLMMTGGREELEKAVINDPELQQVVTKLNEVLRSIQ